jgi:hypothetical protein
VDKIVTFDNSYRRHKEHSYYLCSLEFEHGDKDGTIIRRQ